MTEVRIITAGDPTTQQLEQFKKYASVPDCSTDAMLFQILKRSMLEVQEFSDRAVLPCTLELTAYDVLVGDELRLYQGGRIVTSIVDAEGESVDHYTKGGRVKVMQNAETLTITYSNLVDPTEVERLLPVCYELGTAIYDGEEADKQASILKKLYWAL